MLCRFHVSTDLCPDVATMRLFPGITERTIRNFLQPPLRGCVLETYGTGNAPDTRADFLAALKEAHDRGVVIVNITQCTKGGVSTHYAAGMVCAATARTRTHLALTGACHNRRSKRSEWFQELT